MKVKIWMVWLVMAGFGAMASLWMWVMGQPQRAMFCLVATAFNLFIMCLYYRFETREE